MQISCQTYLEKPIYEAVEKKCFNDNSSSKKINEVMVAIKNDMWTELEPNIFVSSESEIFEKFKVAIAKLKEKEVGKRLIERIGNSAHKTYIHYYPEEKQSHTIPSNLIDSRTKGVGTSTRIHMGNDFYHSIGREPKVIETPFFIALGHELIHHYHAAYGKRGDSTRNNPLWSSEEEYHTIVGYPSKKGQNRNRPKISENALRLEHQLPERYTHLKATMKNLKAVHPQVFIEELSEGIKLKSKKRKLI